MAPADDEEDAEKDVRRIEAVAGLEEEIGTGRGGAIKEEGGSSDGVDMDAPGRSEYGPFPRGLDALGPFMPPKREAEACATEGEGGRRSWPNSDGWTGRSLRTSLSAGWEGTGGTFGLADGCRLLLGEIGVVGMIGSGLSPPDIE